MWVGGGVRRAERRLGAVGEGKRRGLQGVGGVGGFWIVRTWGWWRRRRLAVG